MLCSTKKKISVRKYKMAQTDALFWSRSQVNMGNAPYLKKCKGNQKSFNKTVFPQGGQCFTLFPCTWAELQDAILYNGMPTTEHHCGEMLLSSHHVVSVMINWLLSL